MPALTVKAVVLVDDKGGYMIHGSDAETSLEMFKAMQPIWSFDPATERAHYVEIEIMLPDATNNK